jgi:hypothetical protein
VSIETIQKSVIPIQFEISRTYGSMSTGAAMVEVARTERTAARVMAENFIAYECVESKVCYEVFERLG